jgi:hypothetical protein
MKKGSLFLAMAVVAGTAAPAFAYIDPGSGGMLLQVLLGSVLGLAVWFRRVIGSFFRKFFKK